MPSDPAEMTSEAARLWLALTGMGAFIATAFWRLVGPWTSTIKAMEGFTASLNKLAEADRDLRHEVEAMRAEGQELRQEIRALTLRLELASGPPSPKYSPGGSPGD